MSKIYFIIAAFLFFSARLLALNCNGFSDFKTYGGHYYTTTKDRLTFEYAKTFVEVAGGYLAIPDNDAENEFIASLILGNQFAWIGIYDPLMSNNYCYEDGSCDYSKSRFKTIKNSAINFSRWADEQPDNLLKTSDLNQVTPLGEHWGALNSVDNKWYDFGNHYDQYNNPAKFMAIYEFDTKPECFKDDATNELTDLHCNTAISSQNGQIAENGQLLQCQTDPNGVKYCPANLAACNNVQNTDNGYSQSHAGTMSTSGTASCANGGTLSGSICNKTCQTQSYSCPSGGTLSGSTCTLPFYTITSVGYVSSGSGWKVGDIWSVSGDVLPGGQVQKGTVTSVDGAGNMISYTVDNWGSYYTKGNTSGSYQRNGSGNFGFWNQAVWGDANTRYPCQNNTAICEKTCQTQSYSCPSGGTLSGSTCSYQATYGPKQVLHYGPLSGWFKGPSDGYTDYFSWVDQTNNGSSSAYGTWKSTSSTTGVFQADNGVTKLIANFDSSMSFSGTFTNTNGSGNGTLSGTYKVTGSNSKGEPTGVMNGNWSVYVTENAYSCPSGGSLIGSTCIYQATSNTSNYSCNYTPTLNTSNYSCNYNPICPQGMSSSNGTNCSGSNNYTYYTYHCDTSTNVYNESYAVKNAGGESYTSSTPPTNNCVQQDYKCGANPDQTCIKDGGVWKCSEHPCVDANDMEHTDTEVGSMDGNDDGWNKQNGACNGQLYLFGGTSKACRSWDLYGALDGSECCSDKALLFGLIKCSAEEKLLAEKRKAGSCHYVGEFCSRKIKLGFGKICVQKKKTSCCFNSELARIINEQGRPQINKDWGNASNPKCKGFTPEEFQRLDLSKLDFSEFFEGFQLPNMQGLADSLKNRVTDNINVSFPKK